MTGPQESRRKQQLGKDLRTLRLPLTPQGQGPQQGFFEAVSQADLEIAEGRC